MDSMIVAASRALAAGDPLGALNRVALRTDPPALALRGIAMAQLGDLPRASSLLRRAARGFGPREPTARARCVVALAEIALVARDPGWPARALAAAIAALEANGERANAAHARLLEIRRLLLVGGLGEAERRLAAFDPAPLAPASLAAHEMLVAGVALRRLRTAPARAAFERAAAAARAAGIPSLAAEVDQARRALEQPAARRTGSRGGGSLLQLAEIESLIGSGALVVDGCRSLVRDARTVVPLARRPVLFALVRALGEAWPADVSRADLVARAFGGKEADESHRARLRVEIGRLRKLLAPLARIGATPAGFALSPRASEVAVLALPVEEEHAAVLALLADGESWSSSALAVALGASQRSLQRALRALAAAGKAQPVGRGRARRWTSPPITGFTTTLLLPAPLPTD